MERKLEKVSHLMHSVTLADLIMPVSEAVQRIIQYADWCKMGSCENDSFLTGLKGVSAYNN